jgi:hypothetical protein
MKRKLVVLLLATFLALLAAEVVARAAFGRYIEPIYELDPVVLHRPIPGSSHWFVHHAVNGGGRILVEIDASGYRGGPLAPPGRKKRVAVFGDSYVMAEFSAVERTFCEQLERQLAAASGAEVEVVNAGVPGYGPDQSLLRMEGELAPLRPDLAVVCVYVGNDWGDLLRNKLFRLDSDGKLVRNTCVLGGKVRAEFAAGEAPALVRLARRWWRSQEALDAMQRSDPATRELLASRFVETSLADSRAEYEAYVVRRDDEVRDLLGDHYDVDVSIEPESAWARYKIALMEGVLGRIRDVAEQNGVRVLLVAIPSPLDACDHYEQGWVDPVRYPTYARARLSDELGRIAGRVGVGVVDLFPTFRARGDAVYLRAPDGHWNDLGQELAAELVSKRIVDDGLLGRRPN